MESTIRFFKEELLDLILQILLLLRIRIRISNNILNSIKDLEEELHWVTDPLVLFIQNNLHKKVSKTNLT